MNSLQVKIFCAKMEVESSSAIRASQIDPYVVVFLARDRSQSKKKTTIQKKTLTPMWNEFVFFSHFDINDSICVELKMPAWGSINPVIASTTFTVDELSRMTTDELNSKTYTLHSQIPGIASEITLGFVFDGVIDVVENSKDGEVKISNSSIEPETEESPVYLNCRGAYASFYFFNNAQGITLTSSGADGQVLPYPDELRSSAESMFQL